MHTGRLLTAFLAIALGVFVWSGAASAASTGSLSGVLFADADSDGTLGPGDTPLPGFQVAIVGPNGSCSPACTSTITGQAGAFQIDSLPPGDYTVGIIKGYECSDWLNNSWLGFYYQGFCSHGNPTAEVSIAAGEEATALVPVTGLSGHLGGRLWLDGAPAPAGTVIEARMGDVVCASTTTAKRRVGAGVVVSGFDLTFERACVDGDISLFAGGREFAQTTGNQIWRDAYESWRFADPLFSTHEYASPSFFPFYASVSEPGPVSVRALVGGVICGAGTALGNAQSAIYGLVVLPETVRPGCGTSGATVSFCLGGRRAEQVDYWYAGSSPYYPPKLDATDSPCPVEVRMGDGNCDGDVTLADVTDGLAAAVEGERLPCAGETNTDCAGDATIADLLPVLAYLAGLAPPGAGDCPAVGEAQT